MKSNLYNNLNPSEKQVFDKYKSNAESFAYNLNDSLRRNEDLTKYGSDIDTLDKIIKTFKCPDTVTLYRATTESLILPFIDNSTYTNPEYLSTSKSLDDVKRHFTESQNPVLVTFICSPNTPMADLESNSQFGGDEKEMLLGRQNTFTVLSNKVITNKDEIEKILGKFYMLGVTSLRIIELQN